MARINDGTMRDWKDGDKVFSDLYEEDREILRVAINDNNDQIGTLKTDANGLAQRVANVEGKNTEQDGRLDTVDGKLNPLVLNDPKQDERIKDIENSVTGYLEPVTFGTLEQQNTTFKQLQLGYIDEKMTPLIDEKLVPITSQLAEIVQVNIKAYQHLVVNNDWKPAFDAALAVADKVYVPKGVYSLSTLTIPSGKTIYGDGDSTVFKALGTYIFKVTGTVDTEINVTADVVDFSNSITVSDGSSFAVNNYILLKSQRDCLNETDSGESWTLGYATPGAQGLYFGEFLDVASVSNNVITTKSNAIFPFYKSNKLSETSVNARNNSTVQKVNFSKDVVLKDFKIESPTGTAIEFRYALNCRVSNVKMVADGYTDGMIQFVSMYFSLNCEADNCDFRINHAIAPTQHHYVNVYKCVSSMNCGFYKCYGLNCTQSVDFSYSTSGIPATNCYVDGCTFDNATQTGVTSHGGSYQCRWEGNIIRGSKQGICCRTRNSIITNNLLIGKIETPPNDLHYGIGLYEGQAVDCIISNNTIVNFYTGVIVADAVDLGETFKYCGAIISNNTIKNFTYGVRVFKNSKKQYVLMGIKINNNIIQASHNNTAYGVRLDTYTRGIDIKDNIITSSNGSITNGRGIWCDYNVDSIRVTGNTIRGATSGIFVRGSNDTPVTGGNTLFTEYMNEFINITTPVSVGANTRRFDNIAFKHMKFAELSAIADVLANNNLFVDSADKKLKFKDDTGAVKIVTVT